MKFTKTNTSLLLLAVFLLTSMTIPHTNITKPKQKEFEEFFAKRYLVLSDIPELEKRFDTKFNVLQRIKINQSKKKFRNQLREQNLLDECDIITLKNGEELKAQVTEIGTSEVKYRKCDNKTGPIYTIKKSDIFMVKYANGSKDFFGNEKPTGQNQNEIVNSDEVKTDALAIVSIAAGLSGLVLALLIGGVFGIILAITGVVLGFVSKGRIRKSKGKLKGKGLATAGIVGGLLVIGLSIAAIALLL